MKVFPYGKAICYSGYRANQSPRLDKYPSYEEILKDLKLLETDFDYIRLYDPSQHAKTALKVIKDENLDLKVLLGLDLLGEISNPLCTYGGTYTDEEIKHHIAYNDNQLTQCLTLVKEYDELVIALSAGNESIPKWNDNLVSVERILHFVKSLKKQTNKPVTYCEVVNYWNEKLEDIVNAVDFISMHSYPAWIGFSSEEGIEQTIDDYNTVTKRYPNKPCIITEAGWPTKSYGRGILANKASEESQRQYCEPLRKWSLKNKVVVFFFEAFDEPWKGSENQDEPEKHWGFYTKDRTPKKIIKSLLP